MPDIIKDSDLRNTVESVLDGAEDVLSFFFTNSGSALRRVKTRERKKRVNGVPAEVKSNPVTRTAECTSASTTAPSTPVSSLKSPLFSSQVNNKSFTQWTPLSLSDVRDLKTNQVCTSSVHSPRVDSSVNSNDHKNHVTQLGQSLLRTPEPQGLSPDSCHGTFRGRISLPEQSPTLTLSRKPRRFVYQVQNLESNRTQAVTGTSIHPSYFLHFLISLI